MTKHWQEAQEQAREESGSNFVFTPDGKGFTHIPLLHSVIGVTSETRPM